MGPQGQISSHTERSTLQHLPRSEFASSREPSTPGQASRVKERVPRGGVSREQMLCTHSSICTHGYGAAEGDTWRPPQPIPLDGERVRLEGSKPACSLGSRHLVSALQHLMHAALGPEVLTPSKFHPELYSGYPLLPGHPTWRLFRKPAHGDTGVLAAPGCLHTRDYPLPGPHTRARCFTTDTRQGLGSKGKARHGHPCTSILPPSIYPFLHPCCTRPGRG